MEKRNLEEKIHGSRIADDAEKIWGWGSPAGKKRSERRAELIINSVNGNNAIHNIILEIGCGTGTFSKKFKEVFPNLISIDISYDLIKQMKDTNNRLLITDAEKLCIKNNSLDAIIGSSILHHLDITKFLDISYNTLRNGGNIVLAEPNMLNPQICIQKNIPFIKKIMGDTPHETAFIRFKLKKELERFKFKNIRIIPFDFLHPSTPEFLIPCVISIQKILEKTPLIKEISGSLLIYAEK